MTKMSRICKLFRFSDYTPTLATGGAFSVADETASNSDSDTSLVVVHSTLVSDRSQHSPDPPPSHYIELTTFMSPPSKPKVAPQSEEDEADVHLDSSTLQAIIRIHKSKTQQDNEQMCNEPEKNSSYGDKEETEQQL